jgi:hypothetical protein
MAAYDLADPANGCSTWIAAEQHIHNADKMNQLTRKVARFSRRPDNDLRSICYRGPQGGR